MVQPSSSWYVDRNGIVIRSDRREPAAMQQCVGCGELYVPSSRRTSSRVQRYCGLTCWGRSRTGRNGAPEARP